jgi:hypothetical protein
MVFDPARISPQRTWSDVTAFYRHIEERNDDFRPLRALAERIASQPYADRIFAATSGTALFVAPRPDAAWADEALRIDVDLGGSIRFVFRGRPPAKPESFSAETPTIVGAFERFLDRAGWR